MARKKMEKRNFLVTMNYLGRLFLMASLRLQGKRAKLLTLIWSKSVIMLNNIHHQTNTIIISDWVTILLS